MRKAIPPYKELQKALLLRQPLEILAAEIEKLRAHNPNLPAIFTTFFIDLLMSK